MKRKRLYVQPTTRVVMLQARNKLLAGSVAATKSDYSSGGDEQNWE
ncbi:MAG: hypothetical protein II886_02000 [Prevotella sp.]|nr:hypothetical protein [Prevotella sp.]